jgi:polar amino acid transport system substrate-binding protein
VEIKVVNFDQIIPGIAAGRYDLTVSSMTPTAERMKVLDFVDYLQIGSSVAVPKGNPLKLDENSLCGKRVGVLTGSYQLTVNVPALDKACATAGKPAIGTGQYQDTRQAVSALTSGRQDAVLADSPILSYAAKQNPAIAVASSFEFAPVGVGMPKSSGLVKAVAAALKTVITTPAYQNALGTYGLASGAVKDARVNAAQ